METDPEQERQLEVELDDGQEQELSQNQNYSLKRINTYARAAETVHIEIQRKHVALGFYQQRQHTGMGCGA